MTVQQMNEYPEGGGWSPACRMATATGRPRKMWYSAADIEDMQRCLRNMRLMTLAKHPHVTDGLYHSEAMSWDSLIVIEGEYAGATIEAHGCIGHNLPSRPIPRYGAVMVRVSDGGLRLARAT